MMRSGTYIEKQNQTIHIQIILMCITGNAHLRHPKVETETVANTNQPIFFYFFFAKQLPRIVHQPTIRPQKQNSEKNH